MSKIDLTPGAVVSLLFGGIMVIVLTLVWGGFWSGLALSTLWGWFVVPVFKLPALTILEAYGLALVVQVAKGTSNNIEKSEELASAIAKGSGFRQQFQPCCCWLAAWRRVGCDNYADNVQQRG